MVADVQLPAEVEPYIIGMWRFHEAGQPRLWCITYRWRGCYYDVQGEPTLGKALERVRRALVLLKATEAAKRQRR